MRILLHEYAGHSYAVQLSRQLAREGHEVLHLFFRDFQTPKGDLTAKSDDPPGFRLGELTLGEPFRKTALWGRRRQEIRYGGLVGQQIRRWQPDIVISSNTPLDSQAVIQRATQQLGIPFIFWVQDLYGEAIRRILHARLGLAGQVIGSVYQRLEARLLRRSQAVVAISADFVPMLTARGLPFRNISVIENWAPLEDMPVYPRLNEWTVANDFTGSRNIVYAGTLGYKHDPSVLLEVARALPQASVAIFSEGPGADRLAAQAAAAGVGNLRVRPWVAFADLPRMLAAADLVVALIEPEAGTFSVPSKILSYLALGKPIVAAIPHANLAARIITQAGAGHVVEPGDQAGFVAACTKLLHDEVARDRAGQQGRSYAEQTFTIAPIAARFLDLIRQASAVRDPLATDHHVTERPGAEHAH